MSNMSYCRFENTTMDLQDCIDTINENEINDLSKSERRAFVNLILQAKELAEEFEDYTEDELNEYIEGQQDED